MNLSHTSKPKRHADVPDEAVWYGGEDGGSWITVDKGKTVNSYKIKVFNDFTGEKKIDSLYTLSSPCRDIGLNTDSIVKYIDAFDGNLVLLSIVKDGKYCSLAPTAQSENDN